MKKSLLFILIIPSVTLAQTYLAPDGKTRHRFAQTVFGLDMQTSSGGNSVAMAETGSASSFGFPAMPSARIYISGTHFWGHAEFYFAFQISFLKHVYRNVNYDASQSDVFGIKYYPKPIQLKRLRPYVGFAVSGISYWQKIPGDTSNGPLTTRMRLPLIAGATYCTGKYLIDAGMSYYYDNSLPYYFSRFQKTTIKYPPLTFRLGIRKWLETTRNLEKPYLDGSTEKMYQALKQKRRLSSWFLGLGPSSSFCLRQSPYNTVLYPFIEKPFAAFFPELSAGYFFEPAKTHVALSLRSISMKSLAYGQTQVMKRRSLSLEAFRYLFDYQGFNPYLGLCLSYENQSFSHSAQTIHVNASSNVLAPGVIFGWDILPDKLQWIMLRTNLRYFPNLSLEPVKDLKVRLDQLEFNFIQVVFYPQRFRNFRQAEN